MYYIWYNNSCSRFAVHCCLVWCVGVPQSYFDGPYPKALTLRSSAVDDEEAPGLISITISTQNSTTTLNVRSTPPSTIVISSPDPLGSANDCALGGHLPFTRTAQIIEGTIIDRRHRGLFPSETAQIIDLNGTSLHWKAISTTAPCFFSHISSVADSIVLEKMNVSTFFTHKIVKTHFTSMDP